MEFIYPLEEHLNPTKNEEDNNGFFPFYIYDHGLSCGQIKYSIFIFDTDIEYAKQNKDLNLTYIFNDTMKCRYNNYYGTNHHFLSNETKKNIYDYYFSKIGNTSLYSNYIGIKSEYAPGVKEMKIEYSTAISWTNHIYSRNQTS